MRTSLPRRTLLIVLPILLTSCEDPNLPERPKPYSFVIARPGGFQLIFRWPRESLPVRIWAEPIGDFPILVRNAIRTWQAASIYGEFRGVLLGDSSNAQVQFHLGDPLLTPPSSADALACEGLMPLTVDLDTTIALPLRITLSPRIASRPASVNTCLQRLATKFLGHALGIFSTEWFQDDSLASPDADDLLHRTPVRDSLSARDRITFLTLYHTIPTVRVPIEDES